MEKHKIREAQLAMVTGFLVIYFLFELRGWEYARYLLYFSTTLGVIFLASEVLGNFIVKWWFKLSEGMGWVMSRVILSTIFYVFLFPIAMLSRLFTKNILGLKRPDKSAYTERNHAYKKEDLENIW